MKRLKKAIYILLICSVVIISVFTGAWIYYAQKLDADKIINVTQTVDITDKNGNYVTGVYAKENRKKISSADLPDYVKNAFIAIEDERFYSHRGVDTRRIFGAFFNNLKARNLQEGASTITQQLIKLSHLSSEKTFSRKISEAFLAMELERRYSKEEILEMYLNYCYFGKGAYGIEAGAQKYFGVDASSLSVGQSATLAGILKSPSKYSPYNNPEKSIERRNLVLKQMKNNSFISTEQYTTAVNEPLNLTCQEEKPYPYGYYVDTALYEAETYLGIDAEELLKEGYTIHTNMDTKVQNSMENAVNKVDLPKNENGSIPEVAMVTMSPTGEITGIVGGREHKVRRGINRAMDIKRSPGSAIKPVLVYAPAYENNAYTNATFILDEKQNFNDYSPSNSNNKYYGWITLKKAVALSLNIPAVKTLNTVGIEKSKEYCKSVGIEFEPGDNHLALALGGFEKGVTPLQLTASYVPFMNGGYYHKPTTIRKITDKNGNTVYQGATDGTKVLSEETAFLLTKVMEETVISGTGKKLQSLKIPVSAKTGTSNIQNSNRNKDAWIVAYTGDCICTGWIGNDNGTPLPAGVSGGSYPAMLAEKVFSDIYSDKQPTPIPKPNGVEQVYLDKTAMEKSKKAVIADDYAPESEKLAEYFDIETTPLEYANETPVKITGFSVSKTENGHPKITFDTGNSKIGYTVMRTDGGGQRPVYQIYGQKKPVEYIDTNAENGKSYKYYILAIVGDSMQESDKKEIKVTLAKKEQTSPIPAETGITTEQSTTDIPNRAPD